MALPSGHTVATVNVQTGPTILFSVSDDAYFTYNAAGAVATNPLALPLPPAAGTGFSNLTPGWASVSPSAATGPASTPTVASDTATTSAASVVAPSSSSDSKSLSSSIESQPTTSPPSPTSFSSSARSGSATSGTSSSSPTSSPVPSSGVSKTSLIATATVLGVLLAIALIALLFFIFRRRSNAYTRQESSESTAELKDSNRNVSDLKATIAGLERSLENRDATIRNTQAAALKNGHSFGDPSLGDAEIRNRFAALSQSLNDWVLTYFKGIRLDNVQNPDVAEALRRSVPTYKRLIEDPRSKYLVLRAVISDIVADAFTSGQFIGSAAYGDLKRGLGVNAGERESREWEAMTVALLEKSPQAREQRNLAVETVVRKIDYISSKLAGLEFSEQRTAQLRVSIDNAANLATTVAKQPAHYTMAIERPGTSFDGDTMEDALQETNAYVLRERKIQGTVFPAVLKSPDGSAQGKTLCVRRAQIIP